MSWRLHIRIFKPPTSITAVAPHTLARPHTRTMAHDGLPSTQPVLNAMYWTVARVQEGTDSTPPCHGSKLFTFEQLQDGAVRAYGTVASASPARQQRQHGLIAHGLQEVPLSSSLQRLQEVGAPLSLTSATS